MPVFALRPWRSVRLPQAVTVVALIVGLPLYFRMPAWCDLTLYDLAARNLLEGGVPYRDVFDTNLPGFVWVLTGIRWVFGFGTIALHCADLAIVTGVVLLIDRIARRGGATLASRWWAIAGVALLYPSAVEMAHAQRDTWMALPAVAAVLLRLRRATAIDTPGQRVFWGAVLEGMLWGAAVWIKPHCAIMAAGVWLVTAWRVASACQRRWVGLAADLLGNIAGGLVIGLAGVAWLVWVGAWSEFRDVLFVWGPDYAALAWREFDMRCDQELHWFPPWSLWIIPTVPLAVLSILDAPLWVGRPTSNASNRLGLVGRVLPRWLWDREAGPDARFARGTLATLYLVWAAQAFVVQRGFMYVHMAELFLMFGLWAAHRWAMPAVVLVWLILTSTAWLIADGCPSVRATLFEVAIHDSRPGPEPDKERLLVRHPLADLERLRLWPECWRTNLTRQEQYALWDKTKRFMIHEAVIDWEELDEVAAFLRAKGVKDGELIAWHDSPHALYLMLGIKPGMRYMHINTIQGISPESYARVQAELARTAGIARFAVSDLEYPTLGLSPERRLQIIGPPGRTLLPIFNMPLGTPALHTVVVAGAAQHLACDLDSLLPAGLDQNSRGQFPFNQRAIFRTRGGLGRYVVHELTPPLGDSQK